MRCHGCGAPFTAEHVGVRAVCAACNAYLHCCRNCEFYAPGLANDCREPIAERVADKVLGNFCDHFRSGASAGTVARDDASAARAELDALFKKSSRP